MKNLVCSALARRSAKPGTLPVLLTHKASVWKWCGVVMGQCVSRVRGEGKPVDLTKLTATDRQGNKIGGIVGAVVGLAELVRLQPDVMVDAGQLQCLGVPEAVCQQLVESFRQLN